MRRPTPPPLSAGGSGVGSSRDVLLCPTSSQRRRRVRGDAARRGGAAGGGGPRSPRRSGPLGPHACPPALPEPKVRGRRGTRPRGWAGATGAMCKRGRGRAAGGVAPSAAAGSGPTSGPGLRLASGLGASPGAALRSILEHCGSPRGGLGLKGALEATWGRLKGLWATLFSGS